MIAWSELSPTGLDELKAAIGASPIVLQPHTLAARLAARLADWQTTRLAPDVDEVVLAWLAGHTGHRTPAALS